MGLLLYFFVSQPGELSAMDALQRTAERGRCASPRQWLGSSNPVHGSPKRSLFSPRWVEVGRVTPAVSPSPALTDNSTDG